MGQREAASLPPACRTRRFTHIRRRELRHRMGREHPMTADEIDLDALVALADAATPDHEYVGNLCSGFGGEIECDHIDWDTGKRCGKSPGAHSSSLQVVYLPATTVKALVQRVRDAEARAEVLEQKAGWVRLVQERGAAEARVTEITELYEQSVRDLNARDARVAELEAERDRAVEVRAMAVFAEADLRDAITSLADEWAKEADCWSDLQAITFRNNAAELRGLLGENTPKPE